ncbi:ANTAR domain-containing protein [Caldimonas taiwanensis]|uniref:ANTAR domain-containing protein n=1 Tax=Caldimonas taiwanensis TaxID=307483 RepID=UPI000781572F|nr:ANTAR domain-containing protein [Caldimonas taiwanensis]
MLQSDLEAAGFHVLGATDCHMLVREVVRRAPDGVVAWVSHLDEAWLQAIERLRDVEPCPVLLYTADAEVERLARALQAGVHGCVVQAYAPQRLRTEWALARLRFERERALREELEAVRQRFEERKLVDRAKGLLMRATQMSEEEAFRALRRASMQANRRVGLVAREVIDAARHGEAVNRCGQLRMLSQRLVKLHALCMCGEDVEEHRRGLHRSMQRVDDNLAVLQRHLSAASFGDLLGGVQSAWAALKTALGDGAAQDLAAVDAQAERLLEQAERLTTILEQASPGSTLRILNMAGRQRMLSQRLAKQVLLASMMPAPSGPQMLVQAQATRQLFEDAHDQLSALPLSDPSLRESLQASARAWAALLDGASRAHEVDGRRTVAQVSETLLLELDRLTERFELSLEQLLG